MREDKILKLPGHLDEALKKLIERSFNNAIENISDSEVLYIESSIDNKIKATRSTGLDWVIDLTVICKCIFGLIEEYRGNRQVISEETYKCIGAALFYFINPYDIIPDHEPGIGYLDDYYVVILCLCSICEQDRKLILSKLERL
jgi:uncharacterized membrane protein YkvA (DUF1232 family)